MAKVSFYKITSNNLNSLAIKEGQVVFVTDTKKIYLDNAANSRIEMTPYTANNGVKINENDVIQLEDQPYHILYDDAETVKTGTNIDIDDALDGYIQEEKMSKLSTQETTTGKNKLSLRSDLEQEVNGITFKYEQETQTFTINGTCNTNNTTWIASNLASFNFVTNQTTISAHYISGSISNGGVIRCSSVNFGTRTELDLTQLSSSNPIVAQTSSNTYTATHFDTRFDNGTVANNLKFKLMLADSTDTTYEPYTNGPAPNPDFPQEVKVVNGYRNLANVEDFIVIPGDVINSKTITDLKASSKYILNWSKTRIDTFTNQYVYNFTNIVFYNNNTQISSVNGNSAPSINLNETKEFTYTFTTPENCNKIVINFGNNNGDATESIKVSNVMLNEGDTIQPYVPYGTNWVYSKITGKNLLKTSLAIMKKKNTAGTWNNNVYTYRQVDFIVNDDLSITITGKATGGRADFFLFGGTTDTGDYMYIPQGTYSVYKTGLVDGTLFISWREKTAEVKYTTASNNSAIETMANQDCYFYGVMLGLEDGRTLDQFKFYPMLVSGSTLGEYEAYKEKTIPIPLNNNEICGIGNYKDELIVDKNGHCWLNKKTGKVVLNGTENWTLYGASAYQPRRFGCYNPDIWYKNGINLLSNYFKDGGYSSQTDLTIWTQTQFLAITDINSYWQDATALKTWLNSHNTDVYYVLQELNLINLDYTVNSTLFKGINNISNSEDMDMNIIYYNDSLQGMYDKFNNQLGYIESALDTINGEEI